MTCQRAIGTKYGSGELSYESDGNRKYICLKGDVHIEVKEKEQLHNDISIIT